MSWVPPSFHCGVAIWLVLGIGISVPAASAQQGSERSSWDEAAARLPASGHPAERPSATAERDSGSRPQWSREATPQTTDPLAQPISLAPASAVAAVPSTLPARSGLSLQYGVTTAIGGLAVCLGAFLLFVWATRRSAPPGLAPLPPEVVEPLGRVPLNAKHYLQLIRLGKKLVLLSVSTQGATALAEVSEPAEVDRLAGMCQQLKPQSITRSFREVLGEAGRALDRDFLEPQGARGEQSLRAASGRNR